MENDDYLPQGRSGFRVLVLMVLFLMTGFGIAGTMNHYKSVLASEERMYLTCLDKLVKPESELYATQLSACKGK